MSKFEICVQLCHKLGEAWCATFIAICHTAYLKEKPQPWEWEWLATSMLTSVHLLKTVYCREMYLQQSQNEVHCAQLSLIPFVVVHAGLSEAARLARPTSSSVSYIIFQVTSFIHQQMRNLEPGGSVQVAGSSEKNPICVE